MNYTDVLQELRRLGIITRITPSYLPQDYCKAYQVSDETRSFVAEDVADYVMMLHANQEFYRRAYKRRHQRRIRRKATGDIVVDTNWRNISNLHYRQTDFERVIASIQDDHSLTPSERQFGPENVKLSIKRLTTGDFKVMRYDVDGRMHNVFNQMHERMRNVLYIHEPNRTIIFRNRYNVDYRAMHPTFLGIYLFNILTNHVFPIVVENVDIYAKKLPSEVHRWNTLWTAEEDPRAVLAALWGWTKDKVKHSLLTDLNEPRNYRTPFKEWMGAEFPFLFQLWRSTDVKATGCNLSKFYESELLRNAEFYQFAATMEDVRILCCHDGVSVFAPKEDEQARSKADLIKHFLENLIWRKFQIKPVIKVDEVDLN